MNPFVKRDLVLLKNVMNYRVAVKTATCDTYIESLFVCNKTGNIDGIRINVTIEDMVTNEIVSVVENYLVRKNVTINVIEEIKGEIFINEGKRLIINSNGFEQKFDCSAIVLEYIEKQIEC